MSMKPVVIVGGGWAGMAAAVELVARRVPVIVLEAASQLGGRARMVEIDGYCIDNGQHLMLGAYHEMLRLMRIVGVAEDDAFERAPLDLFITGDDGRPIHIALPRQPPPFHLVTGLYRASGISIREKMDLVRLCTTLLLRRQPPTPDVALAPWLDHHRQPDTLRERLWEPLCLATMNTPLSQASTTLFLRVMRDVFTRDSRDADLLLSRTDLGAVFPEPAGDYVEARGGAVQRRKRVTALHVDNETTAGVTVDGDVIAADQVIVAAGPTACHRLLTPHHTLQSLAATIGMMPEAPICTVYLQYDANVRLQRPLVGLTGTTAQWLFDRARNGQPGLIAVVISGAGVHMALDKQALAQTVIREVATFFPQWPVPHAWHVIREKHATFVARPEVNAARPDNRTPVRGLWLAGDYTNTGYPATLEGAIRSGVTAARGVLQEMGSDD